MDWLQKIKKSTFQLYISDPVVACEYVARISQELLSRLVSAVSYLE